MAEYGRSYGVLALLVAVGCGNELVGADGTGDSSSSTSGSITTITVTSTTSVTATTLGTSADTTNDTATTADTSATTVETSATTEGETGECPIGGAGCPCTGGGTCDPGLVCNDDVCGNPECPIGSAGCPCTGGGACDPGLECVGGDCIDPGGTEGCPVGSAGCPCTGGGACDPGLVCEDDACIDAPASTSDASTSSPVTVTDSASSESGIPADCGDGNIDPGEECDDGDQIQGNGCNLNCTDSGTEMWTVMYAGPDLGDDQARDVAVDGNDDIVVTGIRSTAGEGRDIVTRKYNSNGGLIWERTYGAPAGTHDDAYGVAVDDQNNIVVVGMVFTDDLPTAWIRKYDAAGQALWTDTYVGAMSASNGFGVAIDQAGDIVVVGYDFVPGQGENTWIRKYDADGGELWSVVEDMGAGMNDTANRVTTDAADNVIVVGTYSSTGWARAYDADGGLLWSQEPMNTAWLRGVDTASEVEIFVSGASNMSQGRLQRLDEEGDVQWTQNYLPNGGFASFADVAVDSTGAIIVSGGENVANDNRMLTRKYGSNASVYWTRAYAGDGGAFVPEEASAVEVDSDDNVIVAGYENVDGQEDWWIRKYSP